MREAELLDDLANFQELQNPNWDLKTRIQMCAEAVAYGKLKPEVAELAFGQQVFAQAMPLATELVITKVNTEGVQVRPASPPSTAYGLADRIRSILLFLYDARPTVGRFILSGAVVVVAVFLCVIAIRMSENFFHGKAYTLAMSLTPLY